MLNLEVLLTIFSTSLSEWIQEFAKNWIPIHKLKANYIKVLQIS